LGLEPERDMSDAIKQDRRRFLDRAIVTLAADGLGLMAGVRID
jgi:hypothetical protein